MEKKNKKLPIIIGAVAVAIIAVIVVLVVVNKGHRVIEVKSFNGAVTLERGSSEKDIVKGMHLKSKDTVTTGEDGLVELLVDEDKHIVAEANTCFTITSSGNEKKGKLKIELLYGTSLIEIDNKLPEGSSVELETPNAALSVRGTTFETSYTGDDNTTVVKVTDGVVSVATDEKSVDVEAGKRAIVTDEEIEVIDMPFSHTEETVFEVLYWLSTKETGIFVKKIVGWETRDFEVENSAWNNGIEYCRLFEKNYEWIRYHACTKNEVISSLGSRYARCES
ncbi:MAG: FecR domain-containing protein, partial [Lachnospiraceae bacterium]|nr:FecR domain-containing protein [Lachnospiraceae bacterium]